MNFSFVRNINKSFFFRKTNNQRHKANPDEVSNYRSYYMCMVELFYEHNFLSKNEFRCIATKRHRGKVLIGELRSRNRLCIYFSLHLCILYTFHLLINGILLTQFQRSFSQILQSQFII